MGKVYGGGREEEIKEIEWKYNLKHNRKNRTKVKFFVFGSDVDPKGHYIILASGELGVVACWNLDVWCWWR